MHLHYTHQFPRFRLIATDLDGTLLYNDGSISERTCRLLQLVQTMSVMIVLASARPPRMIREIASRAGLKGVAICCNGAILYDLATEVIIEHRSLSPAIMCSVIEALHAAAPGACFAVEYGLQFGCELAYMRFRPAARHYASFSDEALVLCQRPASKLIVHHETIQPEEISELIIHIAGESVTVTRSGPLLVDITAANVHKGFALEQLCTRLGVMREEVIAFGDMLNDLEMLRWAGHGVAVANAHPMVREQAKEVTLSNIEDGVGLVLERLLPHLAA